MIAALFLMTALAQQPAPPSPSSSSAASPAASDASSVVAGASVAGFVGGAMFALPAVLALLPSAGPFAALPLGLVLAGGGAAFGGFLGELSYARLGGAGVVAGAAAAGAVVGAVAGGLGGLALSSSRGADAAAQGDALFFGFIGAAVGGVGGAAAGGGAGAFWVTPEER